MDDDQGDGSPTMDGSPTRDGSPTMDERDRPCLVVVVGTHTEVGKTWVSARLIEHLVARGQRVEVRKPLQSFDPTDTGPTDAEVLALASGERVADVCPPTGSFEVAMAPPMAAAALGRPVPTTRVLVDGLHWRSAPVRIVETVGGVRSPMTGDGDSAEVVRALQPDVVVLVADAGLGVIDAVRSAVTNLEPHRPVVFLNRFDPTDALHIANRDWLAKVDRLDPEVDVEQLGIRISRGR
ncbi:MAG: ATP-dependent dethiobiotin synthetase BioD [Microthrixaceae bacterium]